MNRCQGCNKIIVSYLTHCERCWSATLEPRPRPDPHPIIEVTEVAPEPYLSRDAVIELLDSVRDEMLLFHYDEIVEWLEWRAEQ